MGEGVTSLNTLEYSEKYDKMDFGVIPLAPRMKTPPKGFDLDKYFKTKPTEQERIGWFGNGANNNIGLIMGALSRAFTFDLDGNGKKVFSEKLHNISERTKTDLLNTMRSKTGSGGTHLICRYDPSEWPEGLKSRLLWKGKDKHDEIRLKGEGGYIATAPSIHPDTGEPYQLENENIPILLTRSQITEIINALRETSTLTDRPASIEEPASIALTPEKMQKLLAVVEPLYTKGSRNDWVYNLSGYLRKGGVSLDNCLRFFELLFEKTDAKENYGTTLEKIRRTYRLPLSEIQGYTGLVELLEAQVGALEAPAIVKSICDLVQYREEAKRKTTTNDDDGEEKKEKKKEKTPPSDILYRLAKDKIIERFRDNNTNEPYAVCLIKGQKQILHMESEDFKGFLRLLFEEDYNYIQSIKQEIDWLAEEIEDRQEDGESFNDLVPDWKEKTFLFKSLDKHAAVIGKTQLENTAAQLIAHIDTTRDLALRLIWNKQENIIYLNLANNKGEIVKIWADKDGNGWDIVNNNDLLIFKTLHKSREQVMPTRNFDKNKRYLQAVTAHIHFNHDHHKTIDEVYAATLMIPGISAPIYIPHGEEGAGKSFLQLVKKSLIDPNETRDSYGTWTEKMTKNFAELQTGDDKSWDRALTIEGNYITYFDNVSTVTSKIMDEMCRWCHPGYYTSKEKKYKNKELSEIAGKRPIGLNGINNPASAGDFLSRVFAPELGEPTNPKDFETALTEFQNTKPELLGYLCHITSKFLYSYPELKDKIQPKTRLDFEVVGEVISRCLGNKENTFQDAWNANRKDQTDATITSSTLAKVLMLYVDKQEKEQIQLTPEILYTELKNTAFGEGFDVSQDRSFPTNAVWLTRQLNKLKASLRIKNIKIDTGIKDLTDNRLIQISKN